MVALGQANRAADKWNEQQARDRTEVRQRQRDMQTLAKYICNNIAHSECSLPPSSPCTLARSLQQRGPKKYGHQVKQGRRAQQDEKEAGISLTGACKSRHD